MNRLQSVMLVDASAREVVEKDREKRYQKASGLVAHLRKLGEKIDALAAKKKEKGPEQ